MWIAKLSQVIQNCRYHKKHLLYDNTQPHTVVLTSSLLNKFAWEKINAPSYSPDLAPLDFHPFSKLMIFLEGNRVANDSVLQRQL